MSQQQVNNSKQSDNQAAKSSDDHRPLDSIDLDKKAVGENSPPSYVQRFIDAINSDNAEHQPSLCAMQALIECLKQSDADTLQGALSDLADAQRLICALPITTGVSASAGCDSFRRYLALTKTSNLYGQEFREVIVRKAEEYVQMIEKYKKRIVQSAVRIFNEGQTVMIHSKSSVILGILKQERVGSLLGRLFITKCDLDASGKTMQRMLINAGFPVDKIEMMNDTAVGPLMRNVDYVLVGAEAVTRDGGIINKVGTLNMAQSASLFHVPFYVVCESFKLINYLPTDTRSGLPPHLSGETSELWDYQIILDYTPSRYITAFVTDIGVYTPTQISEEVGKLYR